MAKKRKIPGLGTGLEQAPDSSKKCKQGTEATEKGGEDAGEASAKTLDAIISKLESGLSEPRVSKLAC